MASSDRCIVGQGREPRGSSPANLRRPGIGRWTLVGLAILAFSPLSSLPAFAEDGGRTWAGTWRNRKFNTTGPLQCTAVDNGDKTWSAQFEGKFQGETFKYEATFSADKKRSQTDLKGTAELDGDRYEWAGHVKGKTLYGQFRSLKGYYGEFVLQEQ